MKEGEYFLEVGLGGAHPTVTEVFQSDYGNSGFSGETFGEVGFAGAHRTAEEVAHRHGFQFVATPKVEVELEPFFGSIEADDSVERTIRFDEFDKPGTISFDQLLFEGAEVVFNKRFVIVVATKEKVLDGAAGCASQSGRSPWEATGDT
jgi:hypothetical protein